MQDDAHCANVTHISLYVITGVNPYTWKYAAERLQSLTQSPSDPSYMNCVYGTVN